MLEEALRKSEKKLRDITSALGEGVLFLNAGGGYGLTPARIGITWRDSP